MKRLVIATAMMVLAGNAAQASPIVVGTTDAATLASAIAGPGITISNPTFSTNATAPSGTFSNGGIDVGFGSGIVLTTGTINCVPGPNDASNCTGAGSFSNLSFDFTSTSGAVFFNYVFASEEYNEYVGTTFNDSFQLLLNGINIALVPGGGGPVTVNNVNCGSNSAFYRNNSASIGGCLNQNLDIQYDGLTTVLTASALVGSGTNTFSFIVTDVGDSSWDSGVFVQAGSFSGQSPSAVPEPATLTMLGVGLAGLSRLRRRRNSAE